MAGVPDPVQKLKTDAHILLHEAESSPQFQHDQEVAKERRMAQMLMEQLSVPASVREVRVHGASNIRRGFLDPLLNPLVAGKPESPTTMGEVLASLQNITQKLNGLQIFREEPRVFLNQPDQASDASSSPNDIDIDLRVFELPRFKLQTGTDVGNGEGSAYGSVLWRNVFGGAENFSLNAKAGTRTRSAYSADLSAPVLSNPDMRVTLEGMSTAAEKPWASHEEAIKGGSVRFSWYNAQRDQQSIEYAGAWRQITGLASGASPTVRADAGDTIKSSLKHTFVRERRDNPQLPQSGYTWRSSWEFAGIGPLGGDVAFSKSETEFGGALPIPLPGIKGRSGVSIGGGLKFGMLYPLAQGWDVAGKVQPSRLNDRFQLGGPTDVRGFSLGGLGPRDGQDAVGGDAYAAGSVNMLLPLPYKGPESSLRFQVFANGGRLVALDGRGRSKESTSQIMTPRAVRNGMLNAIGELFNGAPSMAAGVGLVYAHPVARFELNFSLPLALRKGEVGTKGLQVGVGINFL